MVLVETILVLVETLASELLIETLTSEVLIETAAVDEVGMVAVRSPPPPGTGVSSKVLYVAIS